MVKEEPEEEPYIKEEATDPEDNGEGPGEEEAEEDEDPSSRDSSSVTRCAARCPVDLGWGLGPGGVAFGEPLAAMPPPNEEFLGPLEGTTTRKSSSSTIHFPVI